MCMSVCCLMLYFIHTHENMHGRYHQDVVRADTRLYAVSIYIYIYSTPVMLFFFLVSFYTYNVLDAKFVSSCFSWPSNASPHLSLLFASNGVISKTLDSVKPGWMVLPSLDKCTALRGIRACVYASIERWHWLNDRPSHSHSKVTVHQIKWNVDNSSNGTHTKRE